MFKYIFSKPFKLFTCVDKICVNSKKVNNQSVIIIINCRNTKFRDYAEITP